MRKAITKRREVSARRAGFSLLEVVISTSLVGLMIVPAMQLTASALRASKEISLHGQGVGLAESLMSEILQTDYEEPDDAPAFGVEGSEAAAHLGPRTLWDDVDDYFQWDASPPQAKDGTVLPNLVGWRRTVKIVHVDPDNLSTALADNDDRGVKRITVTVEHDGVQVARLVTIQTTAWLDMIPEPGNDRTTGSSPSI